jgi:hypothetical protein
MNETLHTHRERPGLAGGSSTLFDSAPDAELPVNVSSGPYAEPLPVGNLPIGEIRRRFGDRFDLDPNSQAVLDGYEVGDDIVVRPGQSLMFTRRAGEKGARG